MAHVNPIERMPFPPEPASPVRPVTPSAPAASDRSQNSPQAELQNFSHGRDSLNPQEILELSDLGLQLRYLQGYLRGKESALRPQRLTITFHVHPETGRIITRLLDAETGEVIREVPPMEFLELVEFLEAFLRNLQGDSHEGSRDLNTPGAAYGADPARLAGSRPGERLDALETPRTHAGTALNPASPQ
ncbi:MAG: flagellar protein FlaG [Bacteroidetes bacterium]|nr:flagellar protein FlaG [Rhodothermia bacterium]MCS7156088.1 flagellar protein FlaG [Bacteroidota bacterium]MCX7907776.1 flagellar protein FlaG [Bacteroidota bacterium]MDW8137905.1 flagellar protein FlaG [Bacteroidota bacterium]MDW8286244.1 flagellar protein FlaG [Bacteroidota bacterium]